MIINKTINVVNTFQSGKCKAGLYFMICPTPGKPVKNDKENVCGPDKNISDQLTL